MSTTTFLPTTSAEYGRWRDALPSQCGPQQIPEALLSLYWEACQAGALPTAEAIHDVGYAEGEATEWHLLLATRQVDPACYAAWFAAEDAAADGLVQRSAYSELVQATAERLAAMDHELAARKTTALLSERDAQREASTIEALTRERRELITTQERDFPAMAQALREQQADAAQQVALAKQAVQQAYERHAEEVEAELLAQLPAVVEEVRALLTLGRYLGPEAQTRLTDQAIRLVRRERREGSL